MGLALSLQAGREFSGKQTGGCVCSVFECSLFLKLVKVLMWNLGFIQIVCFYVSRDLLAFGERSAKVVFSEVIFEHLNVLRPKCLPHCTAKPHVFSQLASVFLLDEHHSEALEQDFQLLCSLQ